MSGGTGTPLPRPVRRAGRSSQLHLRPQSERIMALNARVHTAADGRLSPVQVRVTKLVADGLTDAQIARELTWTEGAVSTEVAKARARLEALNRAHLAAIALRRGLIT